ncbi:MAG: ATP-binding protein [Rhizobiaceae bacterium]
MTIDVDAARPLSFAPKLNFGITALAANRFQIALFLGLLLISSVPLLGMTIWVERSAVKKEYAAVAEKHLIVAKNLSLAMSRYVVDIKHMINFIGQMTDLHTKSIDNDVTDLSASHALEGLNLSYIAVLNYKNDMLVDFAQENRKTELPDVDQLLELRALAEASKGQVVFSDISRFKGEPYFFVVKSTSGGGLILAPLSTQYLRHIQKSVAFGKKGHAMIVDATGRVVAHPNPEWQSQSKDASGVPAVQQMMKRQTGVKVFYAPPLKADVIAGHTFVPETGWGVMVPQPVSELVEHARAVQATGIGIAGLSLFLSIIMCWWLSKKFADPINALSNVANRIANGDRALRAELKKSGVPKEIRFLARSFNKMVQELQSKSEQLSVALEQAESGNKAKSDFLATISHELRTPITGVIGTLEILEETELNAEQNMFASTCKSSAIHLNQIIDDVLAFTQMEAGKIRLFNEPTDIDHVVAEVAKMFRAEAAKKSILLKLKRCEKIPNAVQTDAHRLRQILINLVANGLKFTHEGEVSISTRYHTDNENVEWVEFAVRDTGIGISSAVADDLFLPFAQADNSLSRQYGGSGLGLAISKNLVELMGGHIWYSSEPGSGSTFYFNLPATKKGNGHANKRYTGKH